MTTVFNPKNFALAVCHALGLNNPSNISKIEITITHSKTDVVVTLIPHAAGDIPDLLVHGDWKPGDRIDA